MILGLINIKLSMRSTFDCQVSLGWVYLFMGVLIGSAVIPIVLSMTWSRVSSHGMTAGAVTGCIIALVSWLVTASTRAGGLADFLTSTGKNNR